MVVTCRRKEDGRIGNVYMKSGASCVLIISQIEELVQSLSLQTEVAAAGGSGPYSRCRLHRVRSRPVVVNSIPSHILT